MGGCGCRWPITQAIPYLARRPKRSYWPPRLACNGGHDDATPLLYQRIHAFKQQVAQTGERWETQQQAMKRAQERLAEAEQQVQACQPQGDELATDYQTRKLQERPTSRLAQARSRLHAAVKRTNSRTSCCQQAQRRLDKTTAQWSQHQSELAHLYERLHRFEQDNAANADPIAAEFRLDAGFGTYENVALLIEMGYDLSTKPHSHTVVTALKRRVDDTTAWTPVGANAELLAWPTLQLKHCPSPLDVALERFYTRKTLKHSALFHFGAHLVTEQLPGWVEQSHGRPTLEAGMKESKPVFSLHHLKGRSEAAIYLQEAFVLFAANFIRWAARLFASPGAPGRKHAERAQAGGQTPGARGRARLGAGHPGFSR